MKKTVVLALSALFFLAGPSVFAQGKYGADSAECVKYLSYYKEYYKQRSYDDALPNWRKAYKICPPPANQTMLIDGTTLIRRLISKNAKNPVYRAALIDSLMVLHDQRIENYPRYAATALNNKGLDMANYIKDDSKRLYEGYNDIIARNKEQTKAQLFLFDLNAAIDLYQKGVVGAEEVIGIYQTNVSYLEAAPAPTEAAKEQNTKIKTDLESLFISSKVASCEDLVKLFTPRYEAAPEDLALVTNIVKMLSITEGCTDNDLYLKAVTSMYKLEPSHNSAYFLFKLNSSRGNVEEALKYMEEAIAAPESDEKQDAEYNYELATFCYKNGRTAKAYACAKLASEVPEQAGKAYFLMGQIWGSTTCGGDEIQRRSPYWVAIDFLNKAKAADPSLTEEANRMIGAYARYFPNTADAFMYNIMDGQSYSVNCGGMSAVTTVRTQK